MKKGFKAWGGLLALLLMLCAAGLASADTAIDAAHFPDANFRAFIAEQGYDKDGDGVLSGAETAEVTEMDCRNRQIRDLTGIGVFTELETLDCSFNALSALDVSGNSKLAVLYCGNNELTKLTVKANRHLAVLNCGGNRLKALDLSGNPELISLSCEYNHLEGLDVSGNSDLTALICFSNRLAALDLGNAGDLRILECYANELTRLDISECPYLVSLVRTYQRQSYFTYWRYYQSSELRFYFDRLVSLGSGEGEAGEAVTLAPAFASVPAGSASAAGESRSSAEILPGESLVPEKETYLVTDGVLVAKVDCESGEMIAGANFEVVDGGGKVIASWTSTQTAYLVTGLTPGSTYTLREAGTSAGYTLSGEIVFTYREDLNVSVKGIVIDDRLLKMEGSLTRTQVLKADESGTPLAGATLQILTPGGTPVVEWTSTDTAYEVMGLVPGTSYLLREVEAPENYGTAEDIRFLMGADGSATVEGTLLASDTVTITDTLLPSLQILKVDEKGEPLAGAKLEIVGPGGTVAAEWTSTLDPYEAFGLLPGTSYVLREKEAPEGYEAAEDIRFLMGTDGTASGMATAYPDGILRMVDQKSLKVQILKTDRNGLPLPGAVLQLQDNSTGDIVDEWTSTDTVHEVSGLKADTSYTLQEVETPEGYTGAGVISIRFDGDTPEIRGGEVSADGVIRVVNTRIPPVRILKVDESGEPVPGAVLQLQDNSTGDIVDEWTSTDTAHEAVGLTEGPVYTLTEVQTPEGYTGAGTISIRFDGDSLEVRGGEVSADGVIRVVNTRIPPVRILKVDESGEPVPGAVLQLLAPDDSVVLEWTSGTEPYEAEGLLPGSVYVLRETGVPVGFLAAEDLTFTLADYGAPNVEGVVPEDGILRITNRPIPPVRVIKTDLEGNALSGAVLQILDSEGVVIDEWTSTTELHETLVPRAGESYILREKTAPRGYLPAEDASFTLSADGTLLGGGTLLASAAAADEDTGPRPAEVNPNGIVLVRNQPMEIIIRLTKEVTGGTSENGPFRFTVTFTINGLDAEYSYVIRDEESGGIVAEGKGSGTGELELKAGQTAEFQGLYFGTVYTITEAADPRYGVTVETLEGSQRTNTVTGTLDFPDGPEICFINSPMVTDITVTKKWVGGRPANDSVLSHLTLYANGKEVKDAVFVRNGDDYTVYSLPLYDETGAAITYTVKESRIGGYYEPTYISAEGRTLRAAENGSTITNEKTPYVPTWEIKVKKVWSGVSADQQLPSVTLDVYRLNQDGSSTWVKQVTWSAQKIRKNGGYIHIYNLSQRGTYYVVEQVPAGYTVRYENLGNRVQETDRAYDNGTITNHMVPHTGDDRPAGIWIIAAGVSAMGILLVLLEEKRRRGNA